MVLAGSAGRVQNRAGKENIEVVAINDLTDDKTLAHLLKHDSSYGTYARDVKVGNGEIIVGGKSIKIFANPIRQNSVARAGSGCRA